MFQFHRSLSPSHFIGILIGCVGLSLVAQPTPPLSLSLTEALQKVAQSNPELAAMNYGIQATEALTEQAGVRPNPTVEIGLENFVGTGARQGFKDLEATVQASQRIERGNKRVQRIALADSHTEVASLTLALRRTELLAQTATAYVAALAAERQLTLALAAVQLNRETADAVALRVNAGSASPAESARARAAIATAEVEAIRTESGSRNARTALAAIWGGESDDFVLLGSFQLPPTMPAPVELVTQLARHPRLDLQRSEISSRHVALELQHAESKPDLRVSGGLRFLSDGSDAAFVAGLSWPITTRNQNQGNIRAARENLSAAEQSVRFIETELRAAFTTAWQDLTTAHQIALTLRRDALPAIEEALSITLTAYEQGQIAAIEVLFTRRELTAIHREILDAETAYATAAVRIDALTSSDFSLTTAFLTAP
jgi:cobalt-zinc-cadmium efflux system outer membrane protein